MTRLERVRADYRGTGFTAGRHPMALLRPAPAGASGARPISKQAAHGARVRTGGAVICRQRPGTAKGTLFLSLEDETGIANVIVTRGAL